MLIQDRVFGQQKIDEPVILDLLATPQMQRLKGIHQLGFVDLIGWGTDYYRWEHSLGVFFGLRHFGASLKEQIAGLLHDISHTVYSHSLDYLYKLERTQDFADRFVKKFYQGTELGQVLLKHGVRPQEVWSAKEHALLEQPMPKLCLDRVDYTYRDSLVTNQATPEEVQTNLARLINFQGQLVFKTTEAAKWFGLKYIEMNDVYWDSIQATFYYRKFSEIVDFALKQGIITNDDLFTTDDQLVKKLDQSKSRKIQKELEFLRSQPKLVASNKSDYDVRTFGKVRWVDPVVLVDSKQTKPLTKLDSQYKQELVKSKERQSKGFYVKIPNPQ